MLSLLDFSVCVFSDVGKLSRSLSPLGLAFGETVGQYYRGTIAVFLIVLPGTLVLGAVAILVLTFFSRKRHPRSVSFRTTAEDIAGIIHFPSILIVPFNLTFQGALISSASLLRLHRSPGDVALAVGTLVVNVVFIGAVFVETRLRFRCVALPRSRENELAIERHPLVMKLLLVLQWSKEWIDRSPTNFKQRWLMLFESLSVSWYLSWEMTISAAQAIVLGIRESTLATCRWQLAIFLPLSIISVSSAIILRPSGPYFDHGCHVLSKTLICVSCVIIFIETYDSGGNLGSTEAVYVSFAVTLVTYLQAVAAAMIGLLNGARTAKKLFPDDPPSLPESSGVALTSLVVGAPPPRLTRNVAMTDLQRLSRTANGSGFYLADGPDGPSCPLDLLLDEQDHLQHDGRLAKNRASPLSPLMQNGDVDEGDVDPFTMLDQGLVRASSSLSSLALQLTQSSSFSFPSAFENLVNPPSDIAGAQQREEDNDREVKFGRRTVQFEPPVPRKESFLRMIEDRESDDDDEDSLFL